jgi:quercetin dioxygenase-like cupin family protein
VETASFISNCVYSPHASKQLSFTVGVGMKKIELIKNLELRELPQSEKPKQVKEIFSGARRVLIEVTLRNNEILAKHKAAEPITVLCLAGNGTFRAGRDLEDEEKLEAGILLTLEAAVEHEVVAEPELRLLITKFREV